MEFFVDSGDLDKIRALDAMGLCSGVTTNPTIMKQLGLRGRKAFDQRYRDIAQLLGNRPLSVEVTSDKPEEILRQGRSFHERLGVDNLMVKVTITKRHGESLLEVIHTLASEGIAMNVTAMLGPSQAMLAAISLENAKLKALANNKIAPFPHAISIFGGRVADQYGSEAASKMIWDVRRWLDTHHFTSKIIVGSVRRAENIIDWAKTGAHIITAPPDVILAGLKNYGTDATVNQFMNDAEAALGDES